MPGLPPPLRFVEAAEIRNQGQAVPDQTQIPSKGKGYPKEFHNYGNLPLTHPPLQQQQMRLEYPALAKGNYATGRPPGPARHVVNDGDRKTTDLIYHDPKKPKCMQKGGCGSSGACKRTGKCGGRPSDDFSMANYRPKPNPSPCAEPYGCGSPGNCLMWNGLQCG